MAQLKFTTLLRLGLMAVILFTLFLSGEAFAHPEDNFCKPGSGVRSLI